VTREDTNEIIARLSLKYFHGTQCPANLIGYYNAKECVAYFIECQLGKNDVLPASELYKRIEQREMLSPGTVEKRIREFTDKTWSSFTLFKKRPTSYQFITRMAETIALDYLSESKKD